MTTRKESRSEAIMNGIIMAGEPILYGLAIPIVAIGNSLWITYFENNRDISYKRERLTKSELSTKINDEGVCAFGRASGGAK